MPLTNSQYNMLMRSYEEKQLRSRDRQLSHYEEAVRKVPAIREIDNSISALSISCAKSLLEGNDNALHVLKEQIAELRARKTSALAGAGLPADYLEPSYECPDCKDTGYIGNEKCHCFKKAIITMFYKEAHLTGIPTDEDFEHFRLDYYSDTYIDKLSGQSSKALAAAALTECRRFVREFDEKGGNLLLFGTTGIGKTYLTNCIARGILDSVHSVLYLTATEFFDALVAKAIGRSEEDSQLAEQIKSCDLLIIDDLGTERTTEFVISQLFVCLNERILENRSTIISTNLSLEGIKQNYTDRTFSRISNHYRILRLAGDDIRIKKKLYNREDH